MQELIVYVDLTLTRRLPGSPISTTWGGGSVSSRAQSLCDVASLNRSLENWREPCLRTVVLGSSKYPWPS